jgi:hypothetical protein
MSNILKAIANIEASGITDIGTFYRSTNRINMVGDALELYLKDAFCNSFHVTDINQKNKIYAEIFSYSGRQNSPPDFILKGSDAIEVKKIENPTSGLALNSSYPKDKIYADSSLLSKACRTCEEWTQKDLVYIVGTVTKSKLKSIWIVYGDCYAANKETYERIRKTISTGVNELPGVEFSKTKELGRVNKVDPLGITDLRIRGMWGIKSPSYTFSYLPTANKVADFHLNALMLKTKFDSLPKEDITSLKSNSNISIKEVKIPSPNNTAILLDAVLITFSK